MIVVSKATQKTVPEDIRMKMLVLHAPEKLGFRQEYIEEHPDAGHCPAAGSRQTPRFVGSVTRQVPLLALTATQHSPMILFEISLFPRLVRFA